MILFVHHNDLDWSVWIVGVDGWFDDRLGSDGSSTGIGRCLVDVAIGVGVDGLSVSVAILHSGVDVVILWTVMASKTGFWLGGAE